MAGEDDVAGIEAIAAGSAIKAIVHGYAEVPVAGSGYM